MIPIAYVWMLKGAEWLFLGVIGFTIFWIMVGIAMLSKADLASDSADAFERTYGDSRPTDPQEEPAQ